MSRKQSVSLEDSNEVVTVVSHQMHESAVFPVVVDTPPVGVISVALNTPITTTQTTEIENSDDEEEVKMNPKRWPHFIVKEIEVNVVVVSVFREENQLMMRECLWHQTCLATNLTLSSTTQIPWKTLSITLSHMKIK